MNLPAKKTIKNATIINIDCMEYMKKLPDKYFDLAGNKW